MLLALELLVWGVGLAGFAPHVQGLLNADMLHQFYPNLLFQHHELRAGRLPLWNPYQLAGMPFGALQYPESLYPPHLLLLWLASPELAMPLLGIGHHLLAGLFVWLFAGRIGLGAPARIATAVVFMLCGRMIFSVYSPYTLPTLTWLAGTLWALDGLLTRPKLRWAAALGACAGLSVLGGHIQATLFAVPLLAVWALATLALRTRAGDRLRALCWGVAAVGIAVAVALPQLMLSIELAGLASRTAERMALEVAAYPAIPPIAVWKGLLGQLGSALFGPTAIDWGPRYAPQPLYDAATVPLLTLPLALLGWFARGRDARIAWVTFGGLALLYAAFLTGLASPLFVLAHRIPLGDVFRGPSRADFLYLLCVAVVCGVGIEGARQWTSARRGAARASTVGWVLAALIVTGVLWRVSLPVGHPSVMEANPGLPSPVSAWLVEHAGFERVFLEQPQNFEDQRMLVKAGQMHGFAAIPDYEPVLPAAYQNWFDVVVRIPWHGALSLWHEMRRERDDEFLRLLDLMSTRHYVLADPPPAPARERMTRGFDRPLAIGRFRIYERPAALPRAFVVGRAIPAADLEEARRLVLSDEFDPWKEVVIEGRAEIAASAGPGSGAVVPARVVEASADRVVIEATCRSACWLVLTDLHYPGWRARVDGEPTEIRTANGIFRAVLLAPGSHRVVQRYEPLALSLGAPLAAFALAGCVGIGAVSVLRPRGGKFAPDGTVEATNEH